MSSSGKRLPARGNHLLSKLSDDVYAALVPKLQSIQLNTKEILHERGKPFSSYIYFPITSMISVVLPLIDGATVEVGTVGNEGFSAVEMIAGAKSPHNTYMCQIPGEAIRISVVDFKQFFEAVPELRMLAFDHLQCFMVQMAQSVACNSQHATEARFARWMLISHDRVAGDDFKLTQEFLAQMLGVHRPSVSIIANQFQMAGLIQYSRGQIRILNRPGIEEVACECYFDVRNRFEDVMAIQYG